MIQTTQVWEVPPLSSTAHPPITSPPFSASPACRRGITRRRQFKQACHMLLNSNVLPAIPPVLRPSPLDEKAAPANLPVTARLRARGWPSAGVFSSNQRNPKRTLTHPPLPSFVTHLRPASPSHLLQLQPTLITTPSPTPPCPNEMRSSLCLTLLPSIPPPEHQPLARLQSRLLNCKIISH